MLNKKLISKTNILITTTHNTLETNNKSQALDIFMMIY